MRRPSRPALSLLAALAVGLAACGGGGGSTAVLEDNLEAQREAIDALRSRVGNLSDAVDQVSSVDPTTGLSDITARLDELTTRLEQVEAAAAEQAGSEDVTAVVAAEVGKVTEQLDEVVASVRDLTTVVTQVRADVDELLQRFEEHEQDPFAHGGGGGPDPE